MPWRWSWSVWARVLGWAFVVGAFFSPAVWPVMRGVLVAAAAWLELRALSRRTGLGLSSFRPRLMGADRDY